MIVFVLIVFIMTAQGPETIRNIPFETLAQCNEAKVEWIQSTGTLNNAVGCFSATITKKDLKSKAELENTQ